MMWFQRIGAVGCLICLLVALVVPVQAQLSMDVEIDETLSNAQSISIQTLVANDGRGPNLFRMYLQNNSSETINNLYFRIVVESDKIGRIVEIEQLSGQPFSLNPRQRVFANNNNIGNGLPGVQEAIQFDSEFTRDGEEFVNQLQGSTTLPADTYRIMIEIYRGSVGGERLASASAEIGANIIEDTGNIYLLSPGDEVGADAMIASSYPNFQWQGSAGTDYRLIVVEAKSNDSPQSLLDGARSTAPIQSTGSSAGGSLVDYEMLDVITNMSGFQYPNSGVQNLKPGKTYYWRIISQLESSSGIEARESEIWSFTLRDTGTLQRSSEVMQALRQILGDRLQRINEEGYSFQSIVNDEQVFQGGQAMQKLMELGERAQQGDVSIVIEER